MSYVAAYVASLGVMGVLDFAWLRTMVPIVYRPQLGALLAEKPVLWAAAAFYLLYPIGIVLFAVMPGLRASSLSTALSLGAAFGLFAYMTYDLTNMATVRGWSVSVTAIDMLWGAVLTSACAGAGYVVASWLGGRALYS
ncbi:MAG: DUF2177 family protein [Alphaproteobacteria bacterium]|nr:DUF2177 family protein [Alphaproteobacteria bacterium]MBM4437302.1 DUF2177 family protein [Actinomycetota bacterium]